MTNVVQQIKHQTQYHQQRRWRSITVFLLYREPIPESASVRMSSLTLSENV